MREKLVIYMHADVLSRPDWVVIDAEGVCSLETTDGDPVALEALARNREVIVIVPAESILLTSVTLPKMNRTRLLTALPYALEEQLVDDVELLHFASNEPDENGEVFVAIVAHDCMYEWKALLNEWHIKPEAMVPMTLAIPIEEGVLNVVADSIIDVRTKLYSGFACDRVNIMACLNLAFTGDQVMPSVINISNTSSEPCADNLKVTAKVSEDFVTSGGLLEILAKTVSTTPYINLLQGAYSTHKSRLPQTQRLMRGLTVLAVSWVALLFLYPVVSYFMLGGKLRQIDGEIGHIYKQNFPQASSVTAPKMRMNDKLRQLESQTGENKLLTTLGYVGTGLTKAKNVKLKQVNYQNGVITMELSAASSDDFSSFADYLSSAGLSVKQENATLSGSHINATLQVE